MFGLFDPVLLLPQGLAGALTRPQFESIVVHELRHVQYRDNLTAALHMCVETVFWFHPLVCLVIRLETRELPVYSLVRIEIAATPVGTDGRRSSMQYSTGRSATRIIASAQPIARLATSLGGPLGRPVLDETGLEGQYDFKLEWDPPLASSEPGAASNPALGVSLVTALKEALGLRLVSKKAPVQVYVVERIERPTDN